MRMKEEGGEDVGGRKGGMGERSGGRVNGTKNGVTVIERECIEQQENITEGEENMEDERGRRVDTHHSS